MSDSYEFEIKIKGKNVEVFPCDKPNMPVVYLNSYMGENVGLYDTLIQMGYGDFTLVAVSNLDWDGDMTPWYFPPISAEDTPCTGQADAYLQLMIGEIMPHVESSLNGISWRGIAGYSLAGLFAVYSVYKTDVFSKVATMSGSLWFPDFSEYVKLHDMVRKPECAYFSLGDKECKTRNPYLQTVQDNTEAIEDHFAKCGIKTCYKLNPGNHFANGTKRTADGIAWMFDN